MSTSGIKEFAAKIYNSLSAPVNDKAVSISYISNLNSLKIFFFCFFNKAFSVLGTNNTSHAFLTFRNSKFSTVQTFVLLWNLIKVNFKSRSKFTNSNRNTARTKVVTAADHQTYFFIAEQTLNLAFFNSITLLNFSRSRSNRFFSMNLRRTGSTTNTVAASTATKKNNYIPCFRAFTHNSVKRSSRNNSTKLHALSHISRMIKFSYLTSSQTNLVTVRAESLSRFTANLNLRKLTFACSIKRNSRISRTSNAHRLVNPASAAQRIADSTTNTGSRTTKRFNFSRMIMCFVFEHQKPCFFFITRLSVFIMSIMNVNVN